MSHSLPRVGGPGRAAPSPKPVDGKRTGDGPAPGVTRAYRCQCGSRVFFRNSVCLRCDTPLGFAPERQLLLPLAGGPQPDSWTIFGEPAPLYRRCGNFESPAGCNWLVAQEDVDAAGQPASLCVACRLNRTIPDLTIDGNGQRWQKVELAKRRLVSSLLGLGLPVVPKVVQPEDSAAAPGAGVQAGNTQTDTEGMDAPATAVADAGLAFDFIQPLPDGPLVRTGHEHGQITLNIEEADDDRREQIRLQMNEPYRTLLGHLRHEVGHYYWDRLIDGTPWLEPCRALFGDDRADYAEALKQHYEDGPAEGWEASFVSAYASSHPWEDWAETWAHYLHMVDVVDTAASFGLQADDFVDEAGSFTQEDLYDANDSGAETFLAWLHAWVGLTGVINEMSRSMGQADFYPFVLPRAAVPKLHFIDCVVRQARAQPAALGVQPAGEPPAATLQQAA